MPISSSSWASRLTFRNVALAFIGGFFLIQIVSLLITALIPSVPVLKGGPMVLIMFLGISVMSLFILGIRFDALNRKENLIFVVITFGLLIAAYYFLPTYVPQIFSVNPINEALRSAVGTIFGG